MTDKNIMERIMVQGDTGKIVDVYLDYPAHKPPGLQVVLAFGRTIVEVEVMDILETMTVDEYAEEHGVHRNTVLRWITKNNKLLAYRGRGPGGPWLIPTLEDRNGFKP